MTDRKKCIKQLGGCDFSDISQSNNRLDDYYFFNSTVQTRMKELTIDALISNNLQVLAYLTKHLKTNTLVLVFLESLSIGTSAAAEVIYNRLLYNFNGNHKQIYEHTTADSIISKIIKYDRIELLPLLNKLVFDELDDLLWHPMSDNISQYLLGRPEVGEYIKADPVAAILNYLTATAYELRKINVDILKTANANIISPYRYSKKVAALDNILAHLTIKERMTLSDTISTHFGDVRDCFCDVNKYNPRINYSVLAPLCAYGLLNPALIMDNNNENSLTDIIGKMDDQPPLIVLYEKYILDNNIVSTNTKPTHIKI